MPKSDTAIVMKSWVEAFSDKMYLWTVYKTNSKETAEDLVQDTFLAAFQSIEKFEGKSEPKTWLFSILNNKIAEHFRKAYRNPTINESDRSVDAEVSSFDTFFDSNGNWKKEQRPKEWHRDESNLLDNAEFINVLQGCMSKLPNNWFAAVQLKYIEKKSGKLICQELEISPTNFWQILHRAKLKLRKCLEVHWFKNE